MLLRFRYRLYPDAAQREALAKAFGCARVVYNDGLRLRQEAFESGQGFIDDGDLQKRVITRAKRTPERAWPPIVTGRRSSSRSKNDRFPEPTSNAGSTWA